MANPTPARAYHATVAAHLCGLQPDQILDFQLYPDRLAVIIHTGQKYVFTFEQFTDAIAALEAAFGPPHALMGPPPPDKSKPVAIVRTKLTKPKSTYHPPRPRVRVFLCALCDLCG